MRFLLFMTLVFSSLPSLAKDSSQEEMLMAISSEHVQTETLMKAIVKAIMLNEDAVAISELREKPLEASQHNNMLVPLHFLFDEMKERSELRSVISYVNADGSTNWNTRNRFKQVPYRSMEISRAIIRHVLASTVRNDEHLFNADPVASGAVMGSALDFIAFTALRGSEVFQREVAEFIVRGKASLAFRTLLLQYLLDDTITDLSNAQQTFSKPHVLRWLHMIASEFGAVEYERVMADPRLSKVFDRHQRMLAFANMRGTKLCKIWLDSSAE